MIGKIIYGLLSTVSTKVYPGIIPQGTQLPAVSYQIISSVPWDIKNGVASVEQVRAQVNVVSTDYDELDALSSSIRTALDNYSGVVSTVRVKKIKFDDQQDDYDDQAKAHRRIMEFLIWKVN